MQFLFFLCDDLVFFALYHTWWLLPALWKHVSNMDEQDCPSNLWPRCRQCWRSAVISDPAYRHWHWPLRHCMPSGHASTVPPAQTSLPRRTVYGTPRNALYALWRWLIDWWWSIFRQEEWLERRVKEECSEETRAKKRTSKQDSRWTDYQEWSALHEHWLWTNIFQGIYTDIT
jgi:hypothetical protein